MKAQRRAVLFIRCTQEEAERIRAAAQRERRTLSAYILNAVENRLNVEEQIARTKWQLARPQKG